VREQWVKWIKRKTQKNRCEDRSSCVAPGTSIGLLHEGKGRRWRKAQSLVAFVGPVDKIIKNGSLCIVIYYHLLSSLFLFLVCVILLAIKQLGVACSENINS
jgi:hypothetical protein